ncbi:hypothetical protein Rhe02_86600 [Rhizocola hellebori]|uniref:Amino acid adenylation domain-containing protein n=1 Tax=Rhizocola hellebori TaxID=1392758 RepID=A0A8J3QGU0_9ACTN|nr:amino acid adenylation domain-containing protein [Rhizocola hellebori]GIH10593.1 hypothetical protein Rhe02_86600 [Rhizocola hellebori]
MPDLFTLPGPALVSVPQLVEIQAQRQPMALAAAGEDVQLTYGALYEMARQIASELARRGVPTGSVVAAYLSRGPHVLAAQLGIWLNNCVALVVDPSLPRNRVTALFDDAEPKAVIVGDGGGDPPAGPQILALSELKDDGWFPANTPEADQTPAYLIYTSGSTGTPKGVLVGHRSLAHLARWHNVEYAVGSHDRASSLAATAFDAFIWETWPYLCSGASIWFGPEEVRTSPWDLSDWLVDKDISIAFAPTPLAEAYIRHGSKFEQLRTLLTGGDQLRLTGGHPFNELVNHYGPTEATVVATRMPVDPAASGPIGIGWPLPSVHTLILDDEFAHVPVGQTGQLYLGGECLALRYLGDPQRTQTSFHHLEGHPGRWYATGDLVAIENAGLSFKGRADRQVKVRGVRVEPAEVEVVLAGHPSVDDVVVELDSGSGDLIAFVVPPPGITPADGVLREHAARALPAAMVPRLYRFLDKLPLTATGKVDRAALSNFDQH